MSTPCDQPQPPKGLDEDVEPRVRRAEFVKCASCKTSIMWDGGTALWCDNRGCPHLNRVYWNADLKLQLECSC